MRHIVFCAAMLGLAGCEVEAEEARELDWSLHHVDIDIGSRARGTHADSLASSVDDGGAECSTCHASWANNCIGCHLAPGRDDELTAFD